MAFCKECGKMLEGDEKFCSQCGASTQPQTEQQNAEQNTQQNPGAGSGANTTGGSAQEFFQKITDTPDSTNEFDKGDIENNKVFALLSYFAILVLVPIFAAPNSKYAKFHANQGLVLFIAEILYGVAAGIIRGILLAVLSPLGTLSPLYGIISGVISLVGLVFLPFIILGVIDVANGKAKELPLIGKITILK